MLLHAMLPLLFSSLDRAMKRKSLLQHDEQENLVAELAGVQQNKALAISNSPMPVVIDNTSETNQDQLQVNQQQVTDPLALTVTTGSNINRLPETHKVIDQRHAISKFIADGLRQLIVNQSNDASNKIMGSLNISNSLIHISQHFHIGAGQSTEVIGFTEPRTEQHAGEPGEGSRI